MLSTYWKTLAISTGLWTLTFALAAGATARSDVRMMFWSLLVALVSCVFTGWLVVMCAACKAARSERLEMEHLAEIMARVAAEERGVSRIRR